MSRAVNGSRVVVGLFIGFALLVPGTAHAAFFPGFTLLRGGAYAQVDPNPSGPTPTLTDSTGPTDYAVNIDDSDSAGGRTSQVDVDLTAHVDANGMSGYSSMEGTWVATNSNGGPPFPNPNGGTFDMLMRFLYNFSTTTPVTLIIDINTTLVGSPTFPGNVKPMEINHTLTINGDFQDINLFGNTHVEIDLPAGFGHDFEIVFNPNVSTTPWPNVTSTLTSDMTFTIIPEPASAFLALGSLAILALRRNYR